MEKTYKSLHTFPSRQSKTLRRQLMEYEYEYFNTNKIKSCFKRGIVFIGWLVACLVGVSDFLRNLRSGS